MNTTPEVSLVLAGRPVRDAEDSLRRYCGLRWSGGDPQVWAYAYYDAVATEPHRLEPADVTAASALHPGLTQSDLAWFVEHRAEVEEWLQACPGDVALAEATDAQLEHLEKLATFDGVSLALLTKVLHRKRHHLIPLVDRRIIDWYRPITGERNAESAWPRLLLALRADLQANRPVLDAMSTVITAEIPRPISAVRIADIALWMGGVS